MALFKIYKGEKFPETGQIIKATEGFAYFTSDDGKFYIDISGDGTEDAVIRSPEHPSGNRIPLNAYKADIADKISKTLTINLNKENNGIIFNGSKNVSIKFYAPTTGGTANTQALVGNGTTAAPKWVDINPSITITAGTASATPKVNVTVLGQSGTAQAITTATTGVYGATKLTDAYTSTDATLAATGKSILAAIQTLDVAAVGIAAATGNRYISQISETDGKISAILATATIGSKDTPIWINEGTITEGLPVWTLTNSTQFTENESFNDKTTIGNYYISANAIAATIPDDGKPGTGSIYGTLKVSKIFTGITSANYLRHDWFAHSSAKHFTRRTNSNAEWSGWSAYTYIPPDTTTQKPVAVGSASQPVYVKSTGEVTAITGAIANNITGNANTATAFASDATISLTGDITGSANGTHGWSISTTIGSGKVTNAMLAGSITNNKLVNSTIGIAGTNIALGSSIDKATLLSNLGLTNAAHYIGKATKELTDGGTENPTISGYDFANDRKSGDIVLGKDGDKEYIWGLNGWELLGPVDTIQTSTATGTKNRLAYYSAANMISSGDSIYADTSHLTINGTTIPANSGNFQVIGISTMRDIIPEEDSKYHLGNAASHWVAGYADTFYISSDINFKYVAKNGDIAAHYEGDGIYLNKNDLRIYQADNTISARLYLNTLGTVDTAGVSMLTLGNSIVTENINNSSGTLRLYSPDQGYMSIKASTVVRNHLHYLPIYSTTTSTSSSVYYGRLVGIYKSTTVGDNDFEDVGSTSQPVYVTANGVIKAVSLKPTLNNLLSSLTEGAADALVDAGYIISTNNNGATNDWYLRSNVTIWNYIKNHITNDLYWANIKVQDSSKTDTIPTFKTIYFGSVDPTTSGRGILTFSSTYPNHGLWYFNDSTDVITLDGQGKANSKTEADLAINALGAGIISTRNRYIPHTGNTTGTVGTKTRPVYVNAGTITQGDFELKATVNSGTAKYIAYYESATQIKPTLNAHFNWSDLSGATKGYEELVLGDKSNRFGRLALYGHSDASGGGYIVANNPTSWLTHTLPDTAGWIVTAGNGSSTGAGGARNPVYVTTAGIASAGSITFDTLNANCLMWTTATDKPYAGYHYADSTHISIADSTLHSDYNLYVNGATGIKGNIIPITNNTYNLGSANLQWKTLNESFAARRVAFDMGNSPITAGWRRVCKINAYEFYLNCMILITGRYSSAKPAGALVSIHSANASNITLNLLSGYAGSHLKKLRLVSISGSQYWLDIYTDAFNDKSDGTHTTYGNILFNFYGNVTVSDVQTSLTTQAATGGYEIDLINTAKIKLGAELANSYWGMTTATGANNDYIRTTTVGLIPYQSGGVDDGHSTLGTTGWRFKTAYINDIYSTSVHANLDGNADTATAFSSKATVTLTGDTTGTSAGSTKSWSVPTVTSAFTVKGGRVATADSAHAAADYSKMYLRIATDSMKTNKPKFSIEGETAAVHDGHILEFHWDNSGAYNEQLALSNSKPAISVRAQLNGTWSAWTPVLTSINTDWVDWGPGTTAGPTAKLNIGGTTITSKAIPSASTSASGIVTTGAQQFKGRKKFGYLELYGEDAGTAKRYLDIVGRNNAGTQVAEIYYDFGNATNITTGIWSFRQWSPNNTANTATSGGYETYSLPTVTAGLSSGNHGYSILTTKNTVTVAQGGTGNTSFAKDRLIYSESTSKLSAHGSLIISTETTYASRTITPLLRVNGILMANTQIESAAYFMNNGTGTSGSHGYYLYRNNAQYARLFVTTVGTVATAKAAGTAGVASLYLGNGTAQPAAGATTAGANNAYGRILLYGTGTNYTILRSNPNGDRTIYLPHIAGDGYLTCVTGTDAVGNTYTPTYVATNNVISSCSPMVTYTSASNTSASGQPARLQAALQSIMPTHNNSRPEAVYLNTGNGSVGFGYFLSGDSYNTTSKAYGGYFIAHYNIPRYQGISGGTWSNRTIVTNSTNAAMGNASKPVYVDADGILQACNAYPAAANTTTAVAAADSNTQGTATTWARSDHNHHLPTSGVTAGSYGPSANATPGYGVTFNVPYITVDKYGRVTAASTKTVKIPASDNTNTDTKVNYKLDTTTKKAYVMACTSAPTATATARESVGSTSVYINCSTNVLMGAAWNDYAEFRQLKENKMYATTVGPGRVVYENGDDTLSISTERLMRGCNIVSDTYGFSIGESKKAQLPIAVSGRVLAYPYENKEEFKNHIGWPVCSGPNGTVSIMTEEEEMKYPSRIIGTISAVPDYKIWHGGADVIVDGRVWIKVR